MKKIFVLSMIAIVFLVTQVSAGNIFGETIFDQVMASNSIFFDNLQNIVIDKSNDNFNFFPYFSRNFWSDIFSFQKYSIKVDSPFPERQILIPEMNHISRILEEDTFVDNENEVSDSDNLVVENVRTLETNNEDIKVTPPYQEPNDEKINQEKPNHEKRNFEFSKVKYIEITDNGFEPIELEVNVNELVSWKNVRERTKSLIYGMREISSMRSPIIAPRESFTYSFSKPGKYTYVDSIVIGRVGRIIVK